MSLKTGAAILALLGAMIAAAAPAHPAAAQGLPVVGDSCPVAPDASKLPGAAALRQMNSITAHGSRPTGRPADGQPGPGALHRVDPRPAQGGRRHRAERPRLHDLALHAVLDQAEAADRQ